MCNRLKLLVPGVFGHRCDTEIGSGDGEENDSCGAERKWCLRRTTVGGVQT